MKMKHTELIEWAVKGLSAEIDSIEKAVSQGKQYLLQYEKGQQPKTPKTPDEIRQIIGEKKAEIERLYKMKQDLVWEIAMKGENDNESNN